jgi:hypothetical protein
MILYALDRAAAGEFLEVYQVAKCAVSSYFMAIFFAWKYASPVWIPAFLICGHSLNASRVGCGTAFQRHGRRAGGGAMHCDGAASSWGGGART